MRKVLLGSTALVAAGMLAGSGAPAQGAEPITLSVGGYYQAFFVIRAQSDVDNEGVGAVQSTFGNDEKIHNFDIQQEGEVHFTGSTTLDNGITVGVNIQLEAYRNNDQVDEHFVFFSGNFGRLVIGAENSAPYLMHYGAPGAVPGHGVDSPNLWTMVGTAGNAAAVGSPVATPPSFVSDANKISYFTPRFSPGFQFGFSYTPDNTDGFGNSGTGGSLVSDSEDVGQENVISFGVNLVHAFNTVDLAWSFGWEHGFVEGNGTAPGGTCGSQNGADTALVCVTDPDNQQGRDILATGFQIGIGGWKVGGAFQYDDQGQERNNERYEMAVGVTYGAGPWTVGAQGAYGVDQDGEVGTACDTMSNLALQTTNNPVNGANSGCTNDADQVVAGEIGGAYTLGPGVTIGAAVHGWRGWGDDGNENFDGVAFTMGTALSF